MPGFFDVIFGSSPAEPTEPKPKKVKKVKSKAIEAHPLEATVQGLRDEVDNLRAELTSKNKIGLTKKESESDE